MALHAPRIDQDTVYSGSLTETRLRSYTYLATGDETIECDLEVPISSVLLSLHYKSSPTHSNGVIPTEYTRASSKASLTLLDINQELVDPDYLTVRRGSRQMAASVTRDNGIYSLYDGSAVGNLPANSTKLITEAFAKLNDSKVDFGVAMAESSKTASTIIDVAQDALRKLRALKSGKLKAIRKEFGPGPTPAKSLSKRWLQYQYGITPLVNDIYGAAEILNEGLEDPARKFTIQTKRSGTHTEVIKTFGNVDYITNIKQRSTVRLRAELADDAVRGLSLVGLSNPKQVVWELVPFSFVVDWFLPIGTWLKAKDALAGLTFKWGTISTKGWSTIDELSNYEPTVGCGGISGQPEIMQSQHRVFTRRMVGHQDIGTYFKNPLSISHAATIAALIVGLK